MIHGLTPMRCAEPGCPHLGLWQLTNGHCPRHRRGYLNSVALEASLTQTEQDLTEMEHDNV